MTRVIVDSSPAPGQPGGVSYIGRQILLSGRQHDTAGDPRALPAHQIAHALLDHGGFGRREGEGALVDEVFARLLTPVIEQTCGGQPAQDLAQGRIVYRAARLMPAASSPGMARAAVSQARADLYGESADLERHVAEALTAAGLP